MSFAKAVGKLNALILVVALVPLFSAVAADNVTVNVSKFTDEEGKKVKDAVKIALDRWLSTKVVDCVYDHVNRRWDSEEAEQTKLTRADLKDGGLFLFVENRLSPAGIRWKKSKFTVSIENADLGEGINGQAPLNYRGVKKKPAEFTLQLNSRNVAKRSADQLAGTIFHEMLHNVGETHGSGDNYEKAYAGFLIKEWGMCIAGNGTQNFGLTGDRYEGWHE